MRSETDSLTMRKVNKVATKMFPTKTPQCTSPKVFLLFPALRLASPKPFALCTLPRNVLVGFHVLAIFTKDPIPDDVPGSVDLSWPE